MFEDRSDAVPADKESGAAIARDALSAVETALRRTVEGLEPEVLEPGFARRLVETFSRIERLASAGKTLAARQVVRTGAWRTTGDRSAAHWIARQTGSSVGHAVGVLETAQRLAELPATDEAVRAGKLSEAQAREIASAAAATPEAETGLLRAAEFESMMALRERCGRVRAAAASDELDRNEAIRRSRYLRHWSDRDGAFRLDGRLTPDSGAAVLAALEPYKHRMFLSARKNGRREPYEAYAADALVALAQDSREPKGGTTRRSQPPAMIHVLVDHAALARGQTQPGETCEIPGVGPIPVATARALSNDAFLAAIVTDGVDVMAVAHLGRTIPARLHTALEVRDRVCVVPGCDERDGLQIDHIKPVAEGGKTCQENLARLCRWHHYLKTHQGYMLKGEPGGWVWEQPANASPGGDGLLGNPPELA